MDTRSGDRAGPEAPAPQGPLPARRRRARRRALGAVLFLALPVIALAVLLLVLAVSHRPLALPQPLVARIEAQANAALAGRLGVRLAGGAEVVVDDGFLPRVRLRDVELSAPSGQRIAAFPEVRATLWADALLHGRLAARSFRIGGAALSARRLADGRLDFGFGGALSGAPLGPETLAAALEAFEAAFATPALARLERVEADDLSLRLEDARAGRTWWLREGRARLTQGPAAIALRLDLDAGAEGGRPAAVSLGFETDTTGPGVRLFADLRDVAAGDLAAQSPALAALALLDAPISGRLRAAAGAGGRLGPLEAELEVGAGVLAGAAVGQGGAPLRIEAARLHLSYAPAAGRITLSRLEILSPTLRLKARATAWPGPAAGGLPRSLVAQLGIEDLRLDPEGQFQSPARFTSGAADLRLRLAPLSLEIGQVALDGPSGALSAKGTVSATAQGWRIALDARLGDIGRDGLLRLWPATLKPKERAWVATNIAAGQLLRARAALRAAPGGAPLIALSYGFSGGSARVVPTLPRIEAAAGFATLLGRQHRLMVESGRMPAPDGSGAVEIGGSSLVIPDVTVKPPPAHLQLRSDGPIPAVLSILDQPPFRLMSRAGRGTDLAAGRARAVTEIDLPLKKGLKRPEVHLKVAAELTDVVSTTLVPGRRLAAARLALAADDAQVTVEGPGTLDGVPFEGRWRQGAAPEARGRSRVEGRVRVSPEGLARFGIALPAGLVSGAGWAQMTIDLVKGEAPRFAARSDLAGLALAIPGLGWSLPAARTGTFEIAGRLSAPPVIERLALAAPGLSAEGTLDLGAGGLVAARFPKVRVGEWFEGGAEIRGQEVALSGGWLDLRRLPPAGGRRGEGGGAGGRGGVHLFGQIDRVSVTDSLALTGVVADLRTGGEGLRGRATGAVNGAARVSAELLGRGPGRPAVRVTSADAGAVISAAGIFGKARGGSFALDLEPQGPVWAGRLRIGDTRVVDAPLLAEMLSAASIVGLLQQLAGEGLPFSRVAAEFTVSDKAVTVTGASAEGAALGITAAGLYLPRSRTLDIQGVVSPFYLVNGIGQILTRRGEGVFGFNYALTGPASRPKVSINPLSILTPGGLREIFRGRRPGDGDGDGGAPAQDGAP